ncbi:hypothetical protein, partial [Dyella jejuensis]
ALTLDGTGITLSGTKDTDELGDGSSVTETASGNTLDMDAGSTLDDTSGNGGDTINAGTDGTIQINNDGGTSYYDTINATNNAGTITLTGGSSADVDGSGNIVATKGGGDLTASGDAISYTGTSTVPNPSSAATTRSRPVANRSHCPVQARPAAISWMATTSRSTRVLAM